MRNDSGFHLSIDKSPEVLAKFCIDILRDTLTADFATDTSLTAHKTIPAMTTDYDAINDCTSTNRCKVQYYEFHIIHLYK